MKTPDFTQTEPREFAALTGYVPLDYSGASDAESGKGGERAEFVTLAEGVTLIRGDCRDLLPIKADAVISDPPYGMNLDTDNSRFSGGNTASIARRGNGIGTGEGKGIIGDNEPFDPSPWLNYPAVALFGANHYAARLPVGTTLVWLKRHDAGFGSFLSDAEIAWVKGGCGVYAKRDLSMNGEALTRCHPCQKPVALMAWVMERAKVPVGATVLDPYMGSGSTAIACIRTGRKFIGVERDPKHFENARQRISAELAQGSLLFGGEGLEREGESASPAEPREGHNDQALRPLGGRE